MAGRGLTILADVDLENLRQTAETLRVSDSPIEVVRCDIADRDSVASLAQYAASKGPLVSIIHTAGIDSLMGDSRKIFTIDFLGTAWLLDALVPFVTARTTAVCLSSIARFRLSPELAGALEPVLADPYAADLFEHVCDVAGGEISARMSYGIAKYGVTLLCRQLSARWGALGARIISISPGLIDTPMGRLGYSGHPDVRIQAERTPIQRWGSDPQGMPGRADDVASTAAFLCSEGASFITGCDIVVDGGLTAATSLPPF
jgi:NAD(P)-dependent dehydrogenase (short-subunit alcohol dehydrogenase family)